MSIATRNSGISCLRRANVVRSPYRKQATHRCAQYSHPVGQRSMMSLSSIISFRPLNRIFSVETQQATPKTASTAAPEEYIEVDTEFAISKVSFGSILVPGKDSPCHIAMNTVPFQCQIHGVFNVCSWKCPADLWIRSILCPLAWW